MAEKIKVLIFPAGEINSVELHDALCANVNVEVIGASSVERHGPYVFRRYIPGLPMISEPDFVSRFDALLRENGIDVVFPTHDTISLFLAEHRDELSARIITADVETAHICRDKARTYAQFSGCDFCPRTAPAPVFFPCFIKPREGQGSVGARLLSTPKEVPANVDWENYVICEYLPGTELTVDCLTDKDGRLCAVLPRVRTRTMAGVSVAGTAIPATEELRTIAETINRRLRFLGLWYFQVRQDAAGRYKLLEISARCAGTMCLSRARGVNLPLLSVYAAMGRDIDVFENPYTVTVDRTLISRYRIDYDYDTVYIDYDDTIVVDGAVCLPVIRFLYQCRNAGKRLVLLTRHGEDHDDTLRESLRRYAIPETLFDDIRELSFAESKADYIDPARAVFVDNAYAERRRVHEKHGIPVFDVEGVEVLTDWRS